MTTNTRTQSDSPKRAEPRPYLTVVAGLRLDSVPVGRTGKKLVRAKSSLPGAANDDIIPESGRNNTLASLAGTMRRKGMSTGAIEAALQVVNVQKCSPPLDPSEVTAIANSIGRYPAASSADILETLNDAGNAVRLARRHVDDAMYVFGLGWYIWDGLRWVRDGVRKITEMAKSVARAIYAEAAALDNDLARDLVVRHAKSSLNVQRLKGMVDLAQSTPELVASAGDLDAHEMLLGVANGVVNLRTGKLKAAQRTDLLTRHSPVTFDAKAKCPRFEAFIKEVTGGDSKLASYLQRVIGYALTEAANEQCLFFLYGSGANGKSVFLTVLKELLGAELAKQTPSETLMSKRSNQTNDIARLQGVRAVIANEVEEGTLLAESLVKQMTGGEAMTARFHYQEYFEFVPKFKLFIAGNHKPVIQGRDKGIWRRIRLIPFDVTIPAGQRDKQLQGKLRAELSGILNWAIKGCLAWQKQGLAEPAVVSQAVANYKAEMDIIGQWVDARCVVAPAVDWKASEAYWNYRMWAEFNGYKPMASGTFSREFELHFPKVKRKDANYFVGVSRK